MNWIETVEGQHENRNDWLEHEDNTRIEATSSDVFKRLCQTKSLREEM